MGRVGRYLVNVLVAWRAYLSTLHKTGLRYGGCYFFVCLCTCGSHVYVHTHSRLLLHRYIYVGVHPYFFWYAMCRWCSCLCGYLFAWVATRGGHPRLPWSCFSLYIEAESFTWTQNSPILMRPPAPKIPVLWLLELGLQAGISFALLTLIYMCAWDPNSSSHTCVASTSSAEPPPETLRVWLYRLFFVIHYWLECGPFVPRLLLWEKSKIHLLSRIMFSLPKPASMILESGIPAIKNSTTTQKLMMILQLRWMWIIFYEWYSLHCILPESNVCCFSRICSPLPWNRFEADMMGGGSSRL